MSVYKSYNLPYPWKRAILVQYTILLLNTMNYVDYKIVLSRPAIEVDDHVGARTTPSIC